MRKSLLKTVANALIVIGAIAISSLNVFALTDTLSNENKTRTWDFSSNTGTIVKDYAANTEAEIGESGIIVAKEGTAKVTVASSQIQFRNGAVLKVPVPVGSTGSVKIYGNGNTGRMVALEKNANNQELEIDNKADGDSVSYDATVSQDGYIQITSKSDYKFTKIEVQSSAGYTVETTYTITGNITGLSKGTVFTIKCGSDSYDAIVEEDGTKFSVSSKAGFALGTYTAEKNGYIVTYGSGEGFTLTGTSPEFTASTSITFSEKALEDIAAGVYSASEVDAGKPNFDISNVSFVNSSAVNGGKVNGTIKFKLAKAATVIVVAKTGGSNEETFTIGEVVKSTSDKSNNVNLAFGNVPAGETSLVLSGKSGAVISSIMISYEIADTFKASPKGGDYYCIDAESTYIIHPVSSQELEYTSLALANNSTDKAAVEATKTNEVYSSVVFSDDSSISATECGASALYVVRVENTGSAAPKTKYTWIDAN